MARFGVLWVLDATHRSGQAEHDIARRIGNVLAERLQVPLEKVVATADVYGDLAMTSLDLLEAMMCLEDDFGVEFTDRELSEVRTVADISALIKSRVH